MQANLVDDNYGGDQYDTNYDDNGEYLEDIVADEPVEYETQEAVEIEDGPSLNKENTSVYTSTVDPESFRGLLRPAAAEMLGSALFLFVAAGSAISMDSYARLGSDPNVGIKTINISLSFGVMITVLCFAIGHISGGHLNFAVTACLMFLRKISLLRGILYFCGQFFGGLIGIGLLKAVTPDKWASDSCFAANYVHNELTVGHAFVAEFLLTAVLMFVVMAACDPTKSNQVMVPVAIGFTVFICHMIGIPITGCSINPTRTFASAAAASGLPNCAYVWNNQWVFWFAPIAGAISSGFLYELFFNAGGGLINQYMTKKRENEQRAR